MKHVAQKGGSLPCPYPFGISDHKWSQVTLPPYSIFYQGLQQSADSHTWVAAIPGYKLMRRFLGVFSYRLKF